MSDTIELEMDDDEQATPGLDKKVRRQWLNRLLNPNPHVRQNALIEMRDLPAEAQIELTRRCVQRVTGKREEWFAGLLLGFVFAIFLMLPYFNMGFLPIAAWLGAVLTFRPFYDNNIESEVAADLIDRMPYAGFLGFAMTRLYRAQEKGKALRNVTAGRSLRNATLRLLRFVQEEDAAVWNEAEREAFLAPLALPLHDVERTVATLRALERVGGETALPWVQKLANVDKNAPVQQALDSMKISDRKANEQRVQEAAQHCLPVLEQRIEAQRQQQTLLRASGGPEPASVLLRASQETNNTAQEQLLRPR